MLILRVLLLVLRPYSLAQELITCAKACDSCGGPFPLDEQEIYCEMCRECGTTTFREFLTTTAAKITSSQASVTTKSRNRRLSNSGETATRRIENHMKSNSAIRCNGDHKCFYIDKLSKRKIEFFCPEQMVPFCDEIEFEKKEHTVAGRISTRLLCPPSLYCKERPPTTTTKTTTTLLTTTTMTTTMMMPVPPSLPTPNFARRMRFQMPQMQMVQPQMPPSHIAQQHMMPPPHMAQQHMIPQMPQLHLPPQNIPQLHLPPPNMPQLHLPPPNVPYYQPPMSMMMQQPPFSYYQQQQQPHPNLFSQPHPPIMQPYPILTDSKDMRSLAQIMSNAEGPSVSDYLEHEGNYLESDKQMRDQRVRRHGDFEQIPEVKL